MRGFSSTEIRVLALCARYHRKSPPRKSDAEFAALPKDERKRVAALVAILRVADGLDRTHGGIVSAVRCAIGSKTVELRFETTEDPELELWAARRKGDFFEEVFGRKLRFAVEMQADAGPAAGSAKTAGKKAARRVAARRA
jgi:exopolyphosphatase/guanosine-5'-triphosphate,3'-diphosphate pyrophosphatase